MNFPRISLFNFGSKYKRPILILPTPTKPNDAEQYASSDDSNLMKSNYTDY
jgi:hypothetical protein